MKRNNSNYFIISNWERPKKSLVAIAVISFITILGFIEIFIGLSPEVLFGIYGIIVVIPLVIIIANKNLYYGLSVWFFLILFESAGKFALPMVPDIHPHRLMWILIFLFFLIQIALKKRKILPITKIEIAMMLFCVVCLISMVRADTILRVTGELRIRNFLEGYAMPFSIFFLTKNIVKNEDEIKRLFQVLLVIGIYLTLTGLFEHFQLKSLVFPRYIMNPSLWVHWGRARGPFINAAVNGAVIGMLFFSSLYFVINMSKSKSRNIYLIFVALMPITIYFTYTRSGWLGFILSILIIPFFFPRLRKFFFFGLFVIVILVILNWSNVRSEDRTKGGIAQMGPVYSRMNLYDASFRMFLDRPIFGFGFDTFSEQSYDYKIKNINKIIPLVSRPVGRHDTLVGILVELGLAGFIPLILIFFYIFKYSVRLYHKLNYKLFVGKSLVGVFWGISIIFIVTFLTHEMRFFLFPNSFFYLVAGIIVGLNQRIPLRENFSYKNPCQYDSLK